MIPEDPARPGDETVEIPSSVLVRCPLVGFRMRAIAPHCSRCDHFKGLADRFPGAKHLEFGKRFMILCAAEPVRRELFEVAE